MGVKQWPKREIQLAKELTFNRGHCGYPVWWCGQHEQREMCSSRAAAFPAPHQNGKLNRLLAGSETKLVVKTGTNNKGKYRGDKWEAKPYC